MNERANQRAFWIAATLALALLVHLGSLYALPRLVMRRTLRRMGAVNTMHFAQRPTALSRGVVRPSPDRAVLSICRKARCASRPACRT